MRGAVLLAMILAGALAAAPRAVAAEVDEALAAAEARAIQGDVDEAIAGYQRLLEEGADFAGLRYNLGTLLLTRGDLGLAVLHLRTALRQDPGLDDARHNLEVALAARADRVIDEEVEPPLTDRLASVLPPDTAALALLALLAGLALVVGGTPWLPGRRSGVAASALAAALLLSSLAVGVVVGCQAAALRRPEAVVLDDEVQARVAPSVEAAPSFTAHEGLYGVVVEEEAGFARLRLDNGLEAWLPKSALGYVGSRGRT